MAVTPPLEALEPLDARDRGHDVAPRNPCARSIIRRTSSGESVTSAAGASIGPHHNRRLRHFPAAAVAALNAPMARVYGPGQTGEQGERREETQLVRDLVPV